jgi:hypothetical protein
MEREHDEPDGCKVDGCFEEAKARGYCIAHIGHEPSLSEILTREERTITRQVGFTRLEERRSRKF